MLFIEASTQLQIEAPYEELTQQTHYQIFKNSNLKY
jgi:hypothetical protein